MAVESRWVGVGAPAFDALVAVVDTHKAGDPLRPVTVVTPTPAAAVGLRRGLARRPGGIVAVQFQSLDALAEQLAAPLLGPRGLAAGVDRELVVAAVRVALSDAPGRFAGIAHHRSTWETVARTIDEVAAIDRDGRERIRSGGGLGADVVALHDRVAAETGVGGRVAVLRAAVDRIRADGAAVEPLGAIVVHLPGRLDDAAATLVRELGERLPVVVIAGRTGVPAVDEAVALSVQHVGGRRPDDAPAPAATASRVVSTNDIDDEIRAAVRALLAEAEAGRPFHEMALVHPAGSPYTRAVADVLRAADIPFSGPSSETLGHTTPGRVLLALLDVAAQGYSREAVVDLWSCGVLTDGDGRPLRSVVLDERSRRLGIVGGRADFHQRIAARAVWLDTHPPEPGDEADADARRLARHDAEVVELAELDRALCGVEALLDALPADWAGLATWAGGALDQLCGPLVRRSGWPAHELDADTAIRTALGRLGALAAVEPAPARSVVVDTIRAALEAPAPRRSTTGTGVLVTTFDHPPVVPLAAVAVVGLAEGHAPRLGREDVLLSDEVRSAVRLPVSADSVLDQHRALLSSLASSSGPRVLLYARCDQRSGRTQVPSRWLIDAIEALTGARPRTESLVAGRPVDGVEVVASHRAGVAAAATTALHLGERRLAALAAAVDFDGHPASLEPVLAAGATLVRSRAADAFTRFDGNLAGNGTDVLADGDRHLSPTSIEAYATCPRRWFFHHALEIGEVDRPEEIDRLQARDKGTLAHQILERFVQQAIDTGEVPAPGEPWGPGGEQRLLAVAESAFADFERRGLTGHPRWWAYDRDEIVHVLRATLHHDDDVRAATGATPVAVELNFGRHGQEPLRVRLDDGRVIPLAGQADRVDAVPGGVRVYDYKYSSSNQYHGLDRAIEAGGDPVAGGRRLQLLAYAEAAAHQRGVDRSSAWYWFLKPGHTGTHIGYEIGPEHRAMFRHALRVIVDGVQQGLHPARSGPADWFLGTNANCGYCEFDRICPADREDEWERVRSDPALADLVALAEDGAPSFLVTAPVAPADASTDGSAPA